VDSKETFESIISALNEISERMTLFFPVHPRTKERIREFGIQLAPSVIELPPLSFKEALYLWKDAVLVMTDSGGLQEETTALKIPCLTLRNNTERPITVSLGSNKLVGNEKENILAAFNSIISEDKKEYRIPPMWDGDASGRIWDIIVSEKANNQA
jgi:UDP-N-acetylglucosamine 2-epimerase (non-hydrolysing)